MYSILVKSIYNIQNSRPRYSAIHQYFDKHDTTKHVEVDKHFIKEKLDSGLIYTPYVSTEGQLVDVKGLTSV